MKKHLKTFLVVAIIALGFVLRLWRYEQFPVGGETADEWAWTTLGASLIQERIPASWSYFPAYDDYHYKEGVYEAPIVRPVFDHPPLFSLIPGIAHTIKGHWLELPSLKVIRLPMVLLGTVNLCLFWLVARKMFDKENWALVATLLYAVIPSVVFSSRLVVAENGLVTWILLTLLVVLGRQTARTRWWLLALSVAAVLTKITGLMIPASLAIGGGLLKRREYIVSGLVGGALGLGLFALYGALYNWELFIAVFFIQSDRAIGLATVPNRLFMHSTLVRHAYFDGWKWLGIFATFSLLMEKSKKWIMPTVMTLTALFFMAVTVGESTLHGWYDIVLWPTFVLSIAWFMQMMFEKQNGVLMGITWLMLLPTVRLAAITSGALEHLRTLAIRGIVAAGALPLFGNWIHSKKFFQYSAVILLAFILVSSAVLVFSVNHLAYWEQANFFEIW